MESNQVRRAKIKLKVLNEIEGVNWIIQDAISENSENQSDINTIIKNLKLKYLKEIKNENNGQRTLFGENNS